MKKIFSLLCIGLFSFAVFLPAFAQNISSTSDIEAMKQSLIQVLTQLLQQLELQLQTLLAQRGNNGNTDSPVSPVKVSTINNFGGQGFSIGNYKGYNDNINISWTPSQIPVKQIGLYPVPTSNTVWGIYGGETESNIAPITTGKYTYVIPSDVPVGMYKVLITSNGIDYSSDSFFINHIASSGVSSSGQNQSTSDWKTYDSGRGFSLQYPQTTIINTQKVDGGTEVTFTQSTSNNKLLKVSIIPMQGSRADVCHVQRDNKTYTDITINDLKYTKLDVTNDFIGMNTLGSATQYCIIKNDTAYYLTTIIQMSRENANYGMNLNVDTDLILSQMVSSFKLF